MGRELAILVPVLKRPHRARPLAESIRAATPDADIIWVPEPLVDDSEEHAAIVKADAPAIRLATRGNYAQKINAAVEYTDHPYVFLGADDLHFHPGWFEAAKARISDTVGVVGTNDLCNRRVIAGQHSTHSLVARWYCELGTIDEPGKLLHEGYEHEFVDDEFVETAKKRGAFVSETTAVVEHLHPMAGKAPMDELYSQQRRRMRSGRRVFHGRRPLWT